MFTQDFEGLIKTRKVQKEWDGGMKNVEGGRYEEGGDTHVAVYQLGRDVKYRFMDYHAEVFDPADYTKVWEGDLDANHNAGTVYMMLQGARPVSASQAMTSLSVSDILQMDGKYLYVEGIGFRDVTAEVSGLLKTKTVKAQVKKAVKDQDGLISAVKGFLQKWDREYDLGDYCRFVALSDGTVDLYTDGLYTDILFNEGEIDPTGQMMDEFSTFLEGQGIWQEPDYGGIIHLGIEN